MKRNNVSYLHSLLSDKLIPFPDVKRGVSEQFFLLAMTARKLYLSSEYRDFFITYDKLVTSLTNNHELLEPFKKEVSYHNSPIYTATPYEQALKAVSQIFKELDNEKSLISCWAESKNLLLPQENRTRPRPTITKGIIPNWEPILKIIEIELTNGLGVNHIPNKARLGYSHHNLFVSLRCFDNISSSIQDIEKFETSKVLSEAIYFYSKDCNDDQLYCEHLKKITSQEWMNKQYPFDEIKKNINTIKDKVSNCTDSTNKGLVDNLCQKIEESYAMNISNNIKKAFNILINTDNSADFNWKIETKERQEKIYPWNSPHTCHIEIDRTELLKLIETKNISNALNVLGDHLISEYTQAKPSSHLEAIPNNENVNYCNLNQMSDRAKRSNNYRCFIKLNDFSKDVSVLFSEDRKKPSIMSIFDAIKCYDLKEGIFQEKFKLEDAAENISKNYDKNFIAVKGISVTTIKRNYSKVKRVINNRVVDLVDEQKTIYKNLDYDEAAQILKPFWDKPIS